MRCDEFSTRFDELLDERREPLNEPSMAAHAAQCVDCRRTAASISAVVGAMAELRSPPCRLPPFELSVARILAAVGGEEAGAQSPIPPSPMSAAQANSSQANSSQANTSSLASTGSVNTALTNTSATSKPSSFWRGSAFYALFATAATLMLAAYPVWRWNVSAPNNEAVGGGNVAVSPQHAIDVSGAKKVGPDGGRAEAEPLPSFTELARESRDSYARLADDTRRNFDDVLAVASVFTSDAPPHETQPEEPGGWLNQVEHGLEPLKRSTLGTLDVLRQVVPADTESRS